MHGNIIFHMEDTSAKSHEPAEGTASDRNKIQKAGRPDAKPAFFAGKPVVAAGKWKFMPNKLTLLSRFSVGMRVSQPLITDNDQLHRTGKK